MEASRLAPVRETLLESMTRLVRLAEEADVPAFAREAREAQDRLEDNRFHLAVMGQFKRGKSTLVNTLLGEALLPMGVLPLTSVATEIRYGANRQAIIVFEDGRREAVQTDSLALFVTERHNPKNEKGVWRVEVYLPASLLSTGMVITDTPGLGSVYEHNTKTALDYLPRADAVILVLAADSPLSEAELDFVSRVREFIDRTFFLLNKMDTVSESEAREATEFTERTLADRLGGGLVKVWPVSARLGLEGRLRRDEGKVAASGISELEGELGRFMRHAKGREVVKAATRRGLRLAAHLVNHFASEKSALETPLADLEVRLRELNAALERTKAQHREALFVLSGEAQALLRTLDDDIDRFRQEETKSLRALASERFEALKTRPLNELLAALEEFRSARLVADFETWRKQEEYSLNARLKEIGTRFEAKSAELAEQFRRAAANIFGVKLMSIAESSSLVADSRLWYLTGEISTSFLPELNLFTFSPILPRGLILRRVALDLDRNVAEEVDRNCGRVRYDLVERIEETARRMKDSLEERFEATVDGIVRGITRAAADKQKGAAQVGASLRRVDGQLEQLEAVRRDFERVRGLLNGDGD